MIREIILPAIEEEVNHGKNFANLRQIYNAMILATWFKKNLKETLLAKVYADKNKTRGVDVDDKDVAEKIYNQYLEAFKKGAYNYIREDYDPASQQVIPRKYFSGGVVAVNEAMLQEVDKTSRSQKRELFGDTDNAMIQIGLADFGKDAKASAIANVQQKALGVLAQFRTASDLVAIVKNFVWGAALTCTVAGCAAVPGRQAEDVVTQRPPSILYYSQTSSTADGDLKNITRVDDLTTGESITREIITKRPAVAGGTPDDFEARLRTAEEEIKKNDNLELPMGVGQDEVFSEALNRTNDLIERLEHEFVQLLPLQDDQKVDRWLSVLGQAYGQISKLRYFYPGNRIPFPNTSDFLFGLNQMTFKHGYVIFLDRKSTRLNSSHGTLSRMPSSA